MRFATWNINNRNLKQGHLDLLTGLDIHVLAVQEMSPAFHADLAAAGVFDWSTSSLDLRPPKPSESRSRRLGCGIFGRAPLTHRESAVLRELHLPERALTAECELDSKPVRFCSFHAPPGASWKDVKPRTLVAIGEWLSLQDGPLIVGIDANCPKSDHPDIHRNEWWWEDEPLLLGPSPNHHLRDAFRTHLDQQPDELARIVAERPDGPLAVSHVRGNRHKKTPCRYDFICTTPDIGIESVRYEFGDQVRALSDHAIVLGDLRL